MTPRRFLATIAVAVTLSGPLIGLAFSGRTATATATAGVPTTAAAPAASAYTPHAGEEAQNARLRAQLDAALAAAARTAAPDAAARVVSYNDNAAPTFAGQISSSAAIWNASVSNVHLVDTAGRADFVYQEGNSSIGSYAQTDGRGHGRVFIDYTQSHQYYALRIVAHETGHVLGLPDHYSGPCSELMSGGGPGTSCRNAYPDANERSRVEAIWSRLFTEYFALAR